MRTVRAGHGELGAGAAVDIIEYLAQPGGALGPDSVPYKRVAAMLVRAAFHDAGAHSNGAGGADGSAMVTGDEQHRGANTNPLKFMPYVRAALWPVVDAHAISWADALQVAGAAAAQFLGKPDTFTLKVGRCDNATPNPDVLPAANLTYGEFVHYWASVGIEIDDAAALMGSHVIMEDGQGHSDGTQQYQWTNKFYTDSTTGTIRVVEGETAQAVQWSEGAWQYTVNDAFDAPQNVQAMRRCPFARLYKRLIAQFAGDRQRWEHAYAAAYARMADIGATWAPAATEISV